MLFFYFSSFYLPICLVSLSGIPDVVEKKRKSVKGWGEVMQAVIFFSGPLSCHLKNTAQGSSSSLHNGSYVFTLMLWLFLAAIFFTPGRVIRIVIVGTGHLLCFWNITCVATKKEVHPTAVESSSGSSICLLLRKPCGLEGAPWVLQTSGRKAAAPLSLQCVRGGGLGRALWQHALGPAPGGGVSRRPAAPMLPPARYSCWFCSDLRAPDLSLPGERKCQTAGEGQASRAHAGSPGGQYRGLSSPIRS